MSIANKKNTTVSLCRVLATAMVVVCHLGTAYGYSSIAQFFQSGVQVFILISGMLYGKKSIENYGQWMFNRFSRICIPCYIHLAFVICASLAVHTQISIIGAAEILLNIEGYHRIFPLIKNPWVIPGMGHLWFVTVILLCYAMVLVFKKYDLDAKIHENRNIIVALGTVASLGLGFLGVRIDYFVLFLFGYTYETEKADSKKEMVISALLFAGAVALRLLVKSYCDVYGDNNAYLYVVIPWTYNLIAIAIFSAVRCITGVIEASFGHVAASCHKALDKLDSLSYYIFISHYITVDGPLKLTEITPNVIFNIAILLAAVLLLAATLGFACRMVSPVIRPKRR